MRVNIFSQAYGMNGMNKNIIYYTQNILYFEYYVLESESDYFLPLLNTATPFLKTPTSSPTSSSTHA